MGSGDADCTHYLIPHDVLQSWRENRALGAVDRPEDKNLARRALGLEEMAKGVRDGGGKEGEDAWTLNERMIRQLGEFLNYKKLRENKFIRSPQDSSAPSRAIASQPPASPSKPSSAQPGRAYSDEAVLAHVPKTYRARAKSILKRWAEGSDVKYDGDTGVVTVEGRELRGSNIADLLKDAVSKARKTSRPSGFEVLRDYVQRSNIPRTLITNPAWRRETTEYSDSSGGNSDTDATIMPSSGGRRVTPKFLTSSDDADDTLDMGDFWETL